MSELMDDVTAIGEEFAGWGVKATRFGGTIKFVRDGRARVIVSWIGGDRFVIGWEYEGDDWRAQVVGSEELLLETHMTVNADVAR